MEDDGGCANYIRDLEESCYRVFFKVRDGVLVICQALEDILEGVEFEGSEASFCESHCLMVISECGLGRRGDVLVRG